MFFVLLPFLLCLVNTAVGINCNIGTTCSPGRAAAGLCSFTPTGTACGSCQIKTQYTSFNQDAVCLPAITGPATCQTQKYNSFSAATGACVPPPAGVDPSWTCERNLEYTDVSCCESADFCNVPVIVDNCAAQTSCSDCLNNANDICGWCHDSKVCFNSYAAAPSTCNASFIEVLTPGFTKVSDTNYDVTLHPGVATSVPVSWAFANNPFYSIPIKNDFDVFFLVDGSATMNQVFTTLQGLQTQIADYVKNNFIALNPSVVVRFGLGSFIDIPQSPFGQETREYIFKIHQNMTTDYASVATAYTNLIATSRFRNQDPEAVLSAILYAAKRDNAILDGSFRAGVQPTPVPIGWSSTANRLIFVITDSVAKEYSNTLIETGVDASLGINTPRDFVPYVKKYSASDAGIVDENNGDANMAGTPAGTAEGYVTSAQVREALIENDVQLIIGYVDCGAVQNCNSPIKTNRYNAVAAQSKLNDNYNYWTSGLLYQGSSPQLLDFGLNFGGLVNLSSAVLGTDVTTNIGSAITTMYTKGATTAGVVTNCVVFGVKQDPFKRILKFEIDTVSPNIPYGVYRPAGTRVEARIDFFQPQNNQHYFDSDKIVVHILGVGDIHFNIKGNTICQDKCLSATCVGCSNVYQPNDVLRPALDGCGVCAGGGQSCTGCDGLYYADPNQTAVYDDCNVCGGKNLTCAGCEGTPNSGTELNSCGLCNASDSACASWSPVGIAGVTVFIASFIFLAIVALVIGIIYMQLQSLEAKLQKNPLCKEAKQRIQ